MRGKFVIIEGDDGAGKTTFVKYLQGLYPEFVYTREPRGKAREILLGDKGGEIDPLTRFHLFWASRAESLKKVILPALGRGEIVVSDRFDASTFAFQVGGDGERDLEELFWQTRALHMQRLEETYIFFNIPLHVSLLRMKSCSDKRNHFDERDGDYRREVSRFYRVFFDNTVVKTHHSFDADKPLEVMLAEARRLFLRVIE